MLKFNEWLKEIHPDFDVDEGILSDLHPMAGKLVGAANMTGGILGTLGRLYAPFMGMGSLPPPDPVTAQSERPAMIAPLNPGKKNITRLTGVDAIDSLGNKMAKNMNHTVWDGENWIPQHLPGGDSDEAERRNKISAIMKNQAVAMGPKDPGIPPEQEIDPTVPKVPRLTPRMRAKLRSKNR